MKKIYLALFSFFPLLLNAQTITQADLPVAGTAFTMGNDTDFVVTMPAGGSGQVWDYSGMQDNQTDTTVFIAAAGTPYSASFPSSNLARFSQTDGTYSYFTSDVTGIYFDGFENAFAMLAFSPSELFIPVPFSMGSTRDNNIKIQIDTVITDTTGTSRNARFIHRINAHFDADGSGSLTTPTGNYPGVLRIKITELTTDTVQVDLFGIGVYTTISHSSSQLTRYRFVTSGQAVNFIAEIEADSLGTTSANGQFLVDATLNVPKVVENKNVLLYPNPVNTTLNFKYLYENSDLILYDASGKEVLRNKITGNNKINLENIKNGVYHFEIIHSDKIQKGSIVIQH